MLHEASLSSICRSVDLADAQRRATLVLKDFQSSLQEEETELKNRLAGHVAASRVLGKALQGTKQSLEAAVRKLAEAEERAAAAEHAASVLRWHLQNSRQSMSMDHDPTADVF